MVYQKFLFQNHAVFGTVVVVSHRSFHMRHHSIVFLTEEIFPVNEINVGYASCSSNFA
jgi:hypothetical protein